jgi:hypothetical protein
MAEQPEAGQPTPIVFDDEVARFIHIDELSAQHK